MRELRRILILIEGSKMRKAAFSTLLAFGMAVVAHAAVIPCPVAPVQTYLTTFNTATNACSIDGLLFFGFQYTTTASGPAAAPLSTQANLQPITDVNGIGLQFLPTVPFFANATGVSDADLKFIVQSMGGTNIINDLFLELAGTATAGGFGTPGSDVLVETFCPGGTTLPPAAVCPASSPPVTQSRTLTITAGTPSPQSLRITNFATTSSIAIDKDMQVNGNNGSATITSVKNQISIIPEPATSFFVGTGFILILAGSRLRSKR